MSRTDAGAWAESLLSDLLSAAQGFNTGRPLRSLLYDCYVQMSGTEPTDAALDRIEGREADHG